MPNSRIPVGLEHLSHNLGQNWRPTLRIFGCRFFLFSLGKASLLTVMFLAVDRWYAVVKPFKYRRQNRKRRIAVYLALIWVPSCLLQLNKTVQYTLSGTQCRPGPLISSSTSAGATAALIVIYTAVTFYLPSIVTWLTFAHIWLTIGKSATLQQSETKMKLLRMCAALAFFLTICWFPTETMYTLYPFRVIPSNLILHRFTVVLAMFNSILNPIIYCLTNQQYKREFKNLFSCCRRGDCLLKRELAPDIVDVDNDMQMPNWTLSLNGFSRNCSCCGSSDNNEI